MANIIIVTDTLRGFYDIGNLRNPRMARIIPNIVKLLDEKTKDGWKAVFLRDWHAYNDKEFKIYPEHCIRGTEETRIILELERFAMSSQAETVNKTTFSSFYKTRLASLLRKEHPEEVIVVGVCTDICVLFTVGELVIRGYKVTVLVDCVETFDVPGHSAEEVNKWTLKYMRNVLGVKVITSREV